MKFLRTFAVALLFGGFVLSGCSSDSITGVANNEAHNANNEAHNANNEAHNANNEAHNANNEAHNANNEGHN